MRLSHVLLTAVFLQIATTASAAPYPATSTSVLTDPAKGVFFHGFGFKLHLTGTDWKPVASVGDTIFETVRFEPRGNGDTLLAQNSDASLSIRMDQLKEATPLESYARKWMRDYPSYGFEVLGTRSLSIGGGRALLVDMVQKNKNRQLRQVILQREKQVAVVTCLDRRDRFSDTLQDCNRLLKSFEWVSTGSPGLANPSANAGRPAATNPPTATVVHPTPPPVNTQTVRPPANPPAAADKTRAMSTPSTPATR